MSVHELSHGLAAAFLASDWTERDMVGFAREAIGARPRWLRAVARHALAVFRAPPHHDFDGLVAAIAREGTVERALRRRPWPVVQVFLTRSAMREERPFDVPDLPTEAALARWLGLSPEDLDWFADVKGWLARAPVGPLQHYHHRWHPKADGSRRLIEAPKEALKAVQRRLLREVLARVPAHDAAHGFRAGRSVLSFVAPHCGKALVLRTDLRDFFPSVGGGRVQAIFRALGYPRGVASLLTGLCTTRTPEDLLASSDLTPATIDRLRRRHLPQGAPTSPALANLGGFGLDVRLRAAAATLGATYTRYADDLAFSGDQAFAARAPHLLPLVARIARDEGFVVHAPKTRAMPRSARQRLGGLVVNERPNPTRVEFDRLKAILHNCVKHGPASQNREDRPEFRAHLRGRVAWFEHVHPKRGARLRATFDRIVW